MDGTPIDIVDFCEGRRLAHVTLPANLYNEPHNASNLKEHGFKFGAKKGIFDKGILPVCTKDHLSERAIAAVWASPIGRLLASIYHIWKNHRSALIASGYKVAICLITKEDHKLFTQFNPGSVWSTTCRPAYSKHVIWMKECDVFVVNVSQLPSFLKEVKVVDHIVSLKTREQKLATRRAYYAINKDEIVAYQNAHYIKNKDVILAY